MLLGLGRRASAVERQVAAICLLVAGFVCALLRVVFPSIFSNVPLRRADSVQGLPRVSAVKSSGGRHPQHGHGSLPARHLCRCLWNTEVLVT